MNTTVHAGFEPIWCMTLSLDPVALTIQLPRSLFRLRTHTHDDRATERGRDNEKRMKERMNERKIREHIERG